MPICASTFIGNSLMMDRVYQSCVVSFSGHETWVDLIILDIVDLDVILGINW